MQSRRAVISRANRYQALPPPVFSILLRGESLGTRLVHYIVNSKLLLQVTDKSVTFALLTVCMLFNQRAITLLALLLSQSVSHYTFSYRLHVLEKQVAKLSYIAFLP